MEKKTLAEALFIEIPPRSQGRPPAGTPKVAELLAGAAEEILAETGETYSIKTLSGYREVAAWVAGNSPVHGGVTWADASWTAHYEAFQKGLSWKEFSKGKRTKRAVRQQAGASTGDIPAAARAINENPAEADKFIKALSPEGRAAIGGAEVRRTLDDHGIAHSGQHRPTASPIPEWRRHLDTALTNLSVTLGMAYEEMKNGNTTEADHIRSVASDEVARVFAEMAFPGEEVPR
jgi:hypothetical protein